MHAPREHTDLPPQVHFGLEAVEGWLMLGNVKEALAELQAIPQEFRSHHYVLVAEWRLETAAGNLEQAWAASRKLCELLPDCAAAWICQANTVRELRGAESAAELLMSIFYRFPEDPVIAYNLACYLAACGELRQACYWLLQAFEKDTDNNLKSVALADPDLKGLWETLGERISIIRVSSEV